MSTSVNNLKNSFKLQDGFPRPQWKKLRERLKAKDRTAGEDEIWTKAASQWLERLKAHLGNQYEVFETDNFLLLASSDVERATWLLEVATNVMKFIVDTFPDIAKKPASGKLVCLSFSDPQSYYQYISHFYERGEYGGSGGIFISEGYSHFALNAAEQAGLQSALAHELTHALLHQQALPQWLEEGISQLVEEAAISGPQFLIKDRDLSEHKKFWRKHGLDMFWSGSSFSRPDKGQPLSYSLSQVIVRNMLSNDLNRFLQFLNLTKTDDNGEMASRAVFNMTLGDWAAQFLGEGNWDVSTPTVHTLYNRGLFRQSQGAYQKAVADYRQAISQYSKDPRSYQALAWLLSTCIDDDIRDGKKAVAIALRACKLTNWKVADSLDVLAAAYARQGNFAEAMQWQGKAISLASSEKRKDMEARLKSYRDGTPYIDCPRK